MFVASISGSPGKAGPSVTSQVGGKPRMPVAFAGKAEMEIRRLGICKKVTTKYLFLPGAKCLFCLLPVKGLGECFVFLSYCLMDLYFQVWEPRRAGGIQNK